MGKSEGVNGSAAYPLVHELNELGRAIDKISLLTNSIDYSIRGVSKEVRSADVDIRGILNFVNLLIAQAHSIEDTLRTLDTSISGTKKEAYSIDVKEEKPIKEPHTEEGPTLSNISKYIETIVKNRA